MKKVVYIGYDPREEEAYEVCKDSIKRRTNEDNLYIYPLKLSLLSRILTRPVEIKDGKMWCPISEAPMATEFAISRFVIPFLYKNGWVLFIDCDMVCQADIEELFTYADEKYAVMVVKHQHTTGDAIKADGQVQTYYSRKNWSSVVLWNCSHPAHKRLTLEHLNSWPGRDLHAFKWLEDNEIGELPQTWNYLVGVLPTNPSAKMLHFTMGGPWFKDWGIKYPEDQVWWKAYHEYKGEVFPVPTS